MQSNFEDEIFFLTNAMIFQNISHYLQHTVAVQREKEREIECVCLLLSSPLTQYPFKFRHSAVHCGHSIMLPNSKTFRDKC